MFVRFLRTIVIIQITTVLFEPIKHIAEKYRPLVICGPSGVGKGTLVKEILSHYPESFGLSVSHTSRGPREHEQNGVQYNFISKQEFENGIKDNDYIEYANVHGNYYGTHKNSIISMRQNNKICILEIDINGAQNIKLLSDTLPAYYLFVDCTGSLDTLTKRLQGRNTETQEQINTRLQTAKKEYDFLNENPSFFDYILKNDHLITATNEMIDLVSNKWYPWLKD